MYQTYIKGLYIALNDLYTNLLHKRIDCIYDFFHILTDINIGEIHILSGFPHPPYLIQSI